MPRDSEIDRVSRLRVRFNGHDIGPAGRREDDQFAETLVKSKLELGFLVQIDQSCDATARR